MRNPTDQNRIVEEFAQDLLQYSKWQPLETFIYMVYNWRDRHDPETLEKLGGNQESAGKKYRTYVILASLVRDRTRRSTCQATLSWPLPAHGSGQDGLQGIAHVEGSISLMIVF